MMPRISQLAYVGLRVTCLDEWRRFGSEVLGLQVSTPDRDNSDLLLRLDERASRIELHSGESEALEFVGWELPRERDFDMMLENVARQGVDVAEASSETSRRKSYARTASFVDPSGIPTELAFSPIMSAQPFSPPRPMSGFVAGELGLGHLFLYVADLAAACRFYCDVLGFEISDYIVWPEAGIDAAFLRCNPRHHSIALAQGSPATSGTLEHIMLEARSMDDVGQALDAAMHYDAPLYSALGRHINDRMLSFYVCAPSGFLFEYGCDALTVPPSGTWAVRRYTTGHTWGHRLLGNEARLLPFGRTDQSVSV